MRRLCVMPLPFMTAREIKQSPGPSVAQAKCHRTAIQTMSRLSHASTIARRCGGFRMSAREGAHEPAVRRNPQNRLETSNQGLNQRNALVKLAKNRRLSGVAALALAAVIGTAS